MNVGSFSKTSVKYFLVSRRAYCNMLGMVVLFHSHNAVNDTSKAMFVGNSSIFSHRNSIVTKEKSNLPFQKKLRGQKLP